MQDYLEPVEDGLPMRKSGPWAKEKLDYLERYTNVFVTSMHDNFFCCLQSRTFVL